MEDAVACSEDRSASAASWRHFDAPAWNRRQVVMSAMRALPAIGPDQADPRLADALALAGNPRLPPRATAPARMEPAPHRA